MQQARRPDQLYRLIMRNEKRFAWWGEWEVFRRRLARCIFLSLLSVDALQKRWRFLWEKERVHLSLRWEALIRPRPGQITPEFTAPRNWSSVTQTVVIWVIVKLHTLFRIYCCPVDAMVSPLCAVCNWKLCGGARSCENFDGKHSSVQQCNLSSSSTRMGFVYSLRRTGSINYPKFWKWTPIQKFNPIQLW